MRWPFGACNNWSKNVGLDGVSRYASVQIAQSLIGLAQQAVSDALPFYINIMPC